VSDVFLSYSRLDREFALRLHAALVARGKDVWVDEEDIPPTARWREELRAAIEAADSFIFLISPDAAASPECALELSRADELNKRVIPVHVRATDVSALPESLASRQFVPQRGVFADDFDRSLDTLVAAIETDLEWVRAHTAWGAKAREWEVHDRDASFLLSGSELEEAEAWIARRSGEEPSPTELQATYLLLSRQRATRRLRVTRAAVSGALVVAIALSVLALIERATAVSNQHVAESRLLAADAESVLGVDPELSTLLALRGLRTRPTGQAEAALRDALPRLQLVRTLRPAAPLYSPSFSPDGRLVLTASADGAAELWDASTGLLRRTLTAASGTGLEQTLFSPSGNQVLAASDSGTVAILAVDSGRRLGTLAEPGGAGINGAAFSGDGKEIVTAGVDGRAYIWNAASGARLGPALSTNGDIYAVAFSHDGRLVATALDTGVTEIWDAGARRLLRLLTPPDRSALYSVQFSPDGSELVTASGDGVSRVWNPDTGALRFSLREPGAAFVYNAVFSASGARIVTASYAGTARIWDASIQRLAAWCDQRAGRRPLGGRRVRARWVASRHRKPRRHGSDLGREQRRAVGRDNRGQRQPREYRGVQPRRNAGRHGWERWDGTDLLAGHGRPRRRTCRPVPEHPARRGVQPRWAAARHCWRGR